MAASALRNTLLAFTLASGPLVATPQIDPAKEADIRRLIDLTGASKTAQAVMTTMGQQMKPMLEKAFSDHPHKTEIINTFLQRFPERFRMQDLIDRIVPIYDRHLTHDDIKGLIQFYQTPLGQRVLQVLPQIMQESQEAGVGLGREIGPKVMTEVINEIQAREKRE